MMRVTRLRHGMYSFLAQNAPPQPAASKDPAVTVTHRAAFSGGVLGKHQQTQLTAVSEKLGFKSVFWISRAQALKRKVTILPGQEPVVVPADEGGVFAVVLINCSCIQSEDFDAFRGSNPVPNGLSGSPAYFRADRWRLVSDRTFVQKLQSFREEKGYAVNQWLEKSEIEALGLRLLTPDPPIVTIEEGSWTHLFNAEQTDCPEKLATENRPEAV